MSHQELQENNTTTKLRRSRDWFAQKADTVHAKMWLAVLSFTESSIFFIPPDPLLAAMVFVRKDKWLSYTLLTTISAISGAIFGYIVGAILFETLGTSLVEIYNMSEYMDYATSLINESVFTFTLVAAFTPIPFKAAVLAAGFVKADFLPFIAAVVVGRGSRYLLIAYVAKIFGENAEHVMKRFWWYTTFVGVLILAIYAVFYFLAQ